MIKRVDLIRHCERMMDKYESIPDGLYRYLEHKIFLNCLQVRMSTKCLIRMVNTLIMNQ